MNSAFRDPTVSLSLPDANIEEDARPAHLRFRLFPSRHSATLVTPALAATLNGIEVVRILDPELGEGFLSLARLLVACNVGLVDGLARFELRKPQYEVHLGNLAPFDDLWVPLKLFANIAAQLDVDERLAPLLDRKTLHAWSLDDGEEGGILHNWKIPAQLISPNSYSTNAILDVAFDHMVMLADGVQLRTPLDRSSIRLDYAFRSDRSDAPTSFEVLLAQSIGWLSLAYEAWRDGLDADAVGHGLGEVGLAGSPTEGPGSVSQLLWATKTVRGLTALTIDSTCIETIATEHPPESVQLFDGLASLVAQAWREAVQGGQQRSVASPSTHVDTIFPRPSQTDASVAEPAVAQFQPEKRQSETAMQHDQQQAGDLVAIVQALQERVSALESRARCQVALPRSASNEQTGPRMQADCLARLKPLTVAVVVLVSHVVVSFSIESCRSAWAALAKLYDAGHAAIL